MSKKIFISDVHISEGRSLGNDNSYDWLSKHARTQLSTFFYNLAIDETIEEVVLVGDVFDTWVMPINEIPSTFAEILNAGANETIMEMLSRLSKEKSVIYIPGNHDMTAWNEDNQTLIQAKVGSDNFIFAREYHKDGLYAEHGHNHGIFNAEKVIPDHQLPLGYYISRFAATLAAQDQHRFNIPEACKALGTIIRSGASGPDVVVGVVDYLVNRLKPVSGVKVNDEYPILLESGGQITVGEVKERYRDMFSYWEDRTSESWGVAVNAELNTGLLNPEKCRETINVKHCRAVLFGHSHRKDNSYVYNENEGPVDGIPLGVSLNTGTWCDNRSKKEFTYIKVDMATNSIKMGDWRKKFGKETSL